MSFWPDWTGPGAGRGRATSATPRETGRDRRAVTVPSSTRPPARAHARDRRPGARPRRRDGQPSPRPGRCACPRPSAPAGTRDGRRREDRPRRGPSTAPRALRSPGAARRSRWRRSPPSGPAGPALRRCAGPDRPCARRRPSGGPGGLPAVPAAGCAGDLGEPARRWLLLVLVVPVPPFVRRVLGIALGRVLPLLLASERGHVEVAPGSAQRLVAAVVDEVGA